MDRPGFGLSIGCDIAPQDGPAAFGSDSQVIAFGKVRAPTLPIFQGVQITEDGHQPPLHGNVFRWKQHGIIVQ
jgi:hypothetical protein